MAEAVLTKVSFPKSGKAGFAQTLRARVNKHFKEKGLSKYGGPRMWLKSTIIVGMYLVPFILMLTGVTTNTWSIVGSWALMGIGIAGIGMAVMHDANHGSYSANKTVNAAVGYLLNLVGGSAENWKVQHNILHHTYTNIEGLDADITTFPMLRFSPFAKRRSIHKYQHIYAWFFYGLMTVSWIFMKDFKQLHDYRVTNLKAKYETGYGWVVLRITLLKLIYLLGTLALPIYLLPLPWYGTLGCFFMMHFIGGVILGMVFQSAHIMEVCEFSMPKENGMMNDEWAKHQLLTTTDFAPNNKILSWFVGGLNFQAVHHLFPKISHIHYPELAPIVAQTASEFGIEYKCIPTFREAVYGHMSMLRALGREDNPLA